MKEMIMVTKATDTIVAEITSRMTKRRFGMGPFLEESPAMRSRIRERTRKMLVLQDGPFKLRYLRSCMAEQKYRA